MNSDKPLRCPNCGGSEVHPSQLRRMMDGLMRVFGLIPYRCRVCGLRFFEREQPAPATEKPGGPASGRDAAAGKG